MALSFHHSTVPSHAIGDGVGRQPLLDESRVAGIDFKLDRLGFDAGSTHALDIEEGALAWFQVLSGALTLCDGDSQHAIDASHVVFLPPEFNGIITSETGASILFAVLPDAARFDPGFDKTAMTLRIVDWTREPLLLSEHDARKRIYLVTPKLFGTKAIKGEMIIYPPGTEAANHHHEGAAHFMYVLAGAGTCFASEQPFAVREGDLIYYPDRERHYLQSDPEQELRFVEFFVPGQYKTVWAPGASVCTWTPSGAKHSRRQGGAGYSGAQLCRTDVRHLESERRIRVEATGVPICLLRAGLSAIKIELKLRGSAPGRTYPAPSASRSDKCNAK